MSCLRLHKGEFTKVGLFFSSRHKGQKMVDKPVQCILQSEMGKLKKKLNDFSFVFTFLGLSIAGFVCVSKKKENLIELFFFCFLLKKRYVAIHG